jgi:hypothetical protein
MLEFIPHTKRRRMSKARATRIFLARNGICFTCRQQIRQGQPWFIEHPVPIAQGGSDADEDLWPAHTDCKAEKDAVDAAAKAKRDRLVTASLERDALPKMRSAGFRHAPKQRRATARITGKFPGDIMGAPLNDNRIGEFEDSAEAKGQT